MADSNLDKLSARGQSVWIDYLSRDLLETGELKRMMKEDAVVGVTSNPTIFQKAISSGDAYDEQLKEVLQRQDDPKEIFLELSSRDVDAATDLRLARERLAVLSLLSERAAARADTAADAPTWLTEGVADFVGRPVSATPPPALSRRLPSDAELAAAGPDRSAAYDRAWSFATYVADTYGVDGLRALYVRACGHGHPDFATAVREALGAELPAVLTGWQR